MAGARAPGPIDWPTAMSPPVWTPERATRLGMLPALHAERTPDRMALRGPLGERSFAELNRRQNQLARALRARGLVAGDAVALLCANRPEFVEVLGATQRAGLRLTPINWHLTGKEAAYIVRNCEARVLIADARFAEAAREAAGAARERLAVAGPIDGFEAYDGALDGQPDHDLEDPQLGSSMLYTSGTTGRPKGVSRPPGQPTRLLPPILESAAFDPARDRALVTGPLYHAAPLALNLAIPLARGVGCVLMDRWDAAETLRLVEAERITHTHLVPTMFHRLLRLPTAQRAAHDLSTLRWILHGAAPCPVHVKQEMIDWLGPILFEYYAATEGGGLFIGADDWLKHPGSVGRPVEGVHLEVQDDEGLPVGAGTVGTIYFRAPDQGRFVYFKAPEKTAATYRGDFYTMGDLGYVDAGGYLYLTGRSAEVIITGGVNVYPAEIDDVLLRHPAVADVATVGVPNEEWGEEVRAVVQLAPGHEPDEALADELLAHCREHLAAYKCPRRVDWSADLPRLPTGKIVRHAVRARYWETQERSI